jgi:DNA-binding MarR family transcriptional regulator
VSQRIPDPHLNAWRAVLNAHASVVAAVEEALTAAGLPPLAWYDGLWAVRRAPGREARMADLADGLTLSRGGATKLVDRLEYAGLLRRRRADDDGRGFYAVLTGEGEEMLRRMWAVYSRVLRETLVESLGEQQARTIASGLSRVDEAATPRAAAR